MFNIQWKKLIFALSSAEKISKLLPSVQQMIWFCCKMEIRSLFYLFVHVSLFYFCSLNKNWNSLHFIDSFHSHSMFAFHSTERAEVCLCKSTFRKIFIDNRNILHLRLIGYNFLSASLERNLCTLILSIQR